MSTQAIDRKISAHPGSCPHCASLNIALKPHYKACRDCGAAFRGDEILRAGFLDIHYSLDVQAPNGRTLWCESLSILFEAQCDVAAGLRVNPGSSFAKWLSSYDKTGDGMLEDPALLQTMTRIVAKLVRFGRHLRDPYNLEAIERLHGVLPAAGRMWLTLRR